MGPFSFGKLFFVVFRFWMVLMYIANSLFKVLSLFNLDPLGFGFPRDKETCVIQPPNWFEFPRRKKGPLRFFFRFPLPLHPLNMVRWNSSVPFKTIISQVWVRKVIVQNHDDSFSPNHLSMGKWFRLSCLPRIAAGWSLGDPCCGRLHYLFGWPVDGRWLCRVNDMACHIDSCLAPGTGVEWMGQVAQVA